MKNKTAVNKEKRSPQILAALALRSAARIKLITSAVIFVLSLLLSGARVLPGTYPLGIAVIAAAGGLCAGLAATLGCVIGSSGIHAVGGTYALSAVILLLGRIISSLYLSYENLPDKDARGRMKKDLISLASGVKKRISGDGGDLSAVSGKLLGTLSEYSGIMLRENIFVRMALASCAALMTGAWSVVVGGYQYYDLFGAVFAVFITPLFTYTFCIAAEKKYRFARSREICVYLTLCAITLAIESLASLGGAFALAVAIMFSVSYGVHRGAIAGVLCGAVATPIYAPMYTLCALVCGGISSVSRGSGAVKAPEPFLRVLCLWYSKPAKSLPTKRQQPCKEQHNRTSCIQGSAQPNQPQRIKSSGNCVCRFTGQNPCRRKNRGEPYGDLQNLIAQKQPLNQCCCGGKGTQHGGFP